MNLRQKRKVYVTVIVDNRTDWPLGKEAIDWINKAVESSLTYEKFEQQCEVSVSIVSNEEIKQINHQFRKIDKATDEMCIRDRLYMNMKILEKENIQNGEL